jgi:P27 family predicted phage terminase small subunit
MARGRNKKPAAIEVAQGFPGRRKRATNAALGLDIQQHSAAVVVIQHTPPYLGAVGREIYLIAKAELEARHFVKASDLGALGRYARNFERWIALDAALGDETTYETVTNHGTMQRARPEWNQRKDLEKDLRAAEDRFGLNPSFRTALNAKIAVTNDPKNPRLNQPGASPAPNTDPTLASVGFLNAPRPPRPN